MATDTTYTLDQFLADTLATIETKGIPSGLAETLTTWRKLLLTTAPARGTRSHAGRPRPMGHSDAVAQRD